MKTPMNILTAATLALSLSTSCQVTPQEKCKATISRNIGKEGHYLGVNGKVNDKNLQIQLTKMTEETKEKAMSVCMTYETGTPTDCQKDHDDYQCAPQNSLPLIKKNEVSTYQCYSPDFETINCSPNSPCAVIEGNCKIYGQLYKKELKEIYMLNCEPYPNPINKVCSEVNK